jgi:hypothetical protein
MKILTCVLAVSLGLSAAEANANQKVSFDGQDFTVTELLEQCKSIQNDPSAQLACFNALSDLLEQQALAAEDNRATPAEALEDLRTVAEYQDDSSGLSISGSDCKVKVLYFNNYFHISRRNISSIDLFSAEFDASKLQYDQTVQMQGGQAPLVKAVLQTGATAATRGGAALESATDNFPPKSPRASIADYANEVSNVLPATEGQTFNFVLVHPNRTEDSAKIWEAFEAFAEACEK